ncbi:MAG: tRNA pseudouridine(55) synthase TruB [Firmicutes bacterium]|nr:tRNA pseudouridine(55) synthase TruB [Bacillota bacterium]
MRDGILLLNKPQGWTSSDCVAICRRALKCKGIKKVGHGGTLDPMATGLLPIFVGQATRIMEYLELDYKEYKCTCRLGTITDTLDIWGEVIEERPWKETVSEKNVIDAFAEFTGHIEQIPPKYSAVRVDGKRLYEYAHKGLEIDFELKPRHVYIKSLDILDINMETGEITFTIVCSKGTYIRTICSDLGEKLGCGCIMTGLVRTATGNLSLNGELPVTDPIGIKGLLADSDSDDVASRLEKILLAPDYPLVHFGRAVMSHERMIYFSRGNSIRSRQIKWESEPEIDTEASEGIMPVNARGRKYSCIYRVYEEENNRFLGTGFYDKKEGLLKADKVFVEREP